MSHDLEDAVRDALRRSAELAPRDVDLDKVRRRARSLHRRRVAEAAAVAVATVLVVGAGALALGRTTLNTTPVAPAPTPAPSLAEPTSSPLPSPRFSSPPAQAAGVNLPWTAWVAQPDPVGTEQRDSEVWVTTGAYAGWRAVSLGTEPVDLLAWWNQHSLVLASGTDLKTLSLLHLDESGHATAPPEKLTIGDSESGLGFRLAGGGFAWAWPQAGGTDWSIAYLDSTGQEQRPRSTVTGHPLAVSRDYIVTEADQGGVRVYDGDQGSLTTAACPSEIALAAGPTPEGLVALLCAGRGPTDQTVVAIDIPHLVTGKASGSRDPITRLGHPMPGLDATTLLWWTPDGRLNLSVDVTNPNGYYTSVTTFAWIRSDSWSLEDARVAAVPVSSGVQIVLDEPGQLGRNAGNRIRWWLIGRDSAVPLGPGVDAPWGWPLPRESN